MGARGRVDPDSKSRETQPGQIRNSSRENPDTDPRGLRQSGARTREHRRGPDRYVAVSGACYNTAIERIAAIVGAASVRQLPRLPGHAPLVG